MGIWRILFVSLVCMCSIFSEAALRDSVNTPPGTKGNQPPSNPSTNQGKSRKCTATPILVVGGGWAGMAAARTLSERGCKVVLLEAKDRLGGRTFTNDQYKLEIGTNWIHGQEGPFWFSACDETGCDGGGGLPDDLSAPVPHLFLQLLDDLGYNRSDENRLVDGGDSSYVGLGSTPPPIWRFGSKTFDTSRIAEGFALSEQYYELVTQWVTARLEGNNGTRAYRDTVLELMTSREPLKSHFAALSADDKRLMIWHVENIFLEDWAGELSGYSALSFDPYYAFFQGGNSVTKQGFSEVVRRFKAKLTTAGVDIRLNTRVTQIDRDSSVCTVHLSDGKKISSPHCIVTVSLGVLKAETITFSPPLPSSHSNAIAALDMGVQEHVWLIFDSLSWLPDQSLYSIYIGPNETWAPFFGTLFSGAIEREGSTALGYFHDASGKWKLFLSDEEIIDRSIETLSVAFPGVEVPRPISVVRSNWTFDDDIRGCYAYFLPGADQTSLLAFSNPVDEVLHFAGEHTAFTSWGFAYGAYASGVREARAVLASPENSALPQISLLEFNQMTAYVFDIPAGYYEETFGKTKTRNVASKRRAAQAHRRVARKASKK